MPAIRVQNFGGIAPRLSDRLLHASSATIAENCKLWSGEVRPFRAPRIVEEELKDGEIKTLYRLRDAWLSWTQDVDVARGFIPGDASERFYYTGDGAPKVSDYIMATSASPYPNSSFDLGINAPTSKPTVALGVGGSGTAIATAYLYTFVTAFNEESVPSDPSLIINVLPGQSVIVSGFSVPTSQNVSSIRVYRALQGSTATNFYFVAEIPLGTTAYTDNVLAQYLGESLSSQQYYPPPASMQGLTSHPNGFLAGFTSNRLHLSESYQPHAWPPEYVKVFDSPVVALGVYGSTIVVATTGFVYLVSGVDPKHMTVEKLPDPYPCISKRSMVSGDRGVIYASNDGLVWVGYGGLQVITRDVLSRDEWQIWNPSTMHGSVYDGRYVGFMLQNVTDDQDFDRANDEQTAKGFLFDYSDRATGVDQRDKLTTFDFYSTAVFAAPGEAFFYVTRSNSQNTFLEWEAGTGYGQYTWRSKAFATPALTSFAAAKVIGRYAWQDDPDTGRTVEFELWSGTKLKYARQVTTNEPFRLPRFYRETEAWYLLIRGTEFIQEVHIATSIEDLKEAA